jgi:hypothetical protein
LCQSGNDKELFKSLNQLSQSGKFSEASHCLTLSKKTKFHNRQRELFHIRVLSWNKEYKRARKKLQQMKKRRIGVGTNSTRSCIGMRKILKKPIRLTKMLKKNWD